jgi:predicted permease
MRRWFRRGRLDAERAREMQAHLDHHVDDLIAAGYPRDRALREARRRFGNPTVIREEIYRMNTLPLVETVLRDVRYAGRMLRKTPGFTAIALVTLAVGIGVNTAIFTVVNALLLTPLPYPGPERLATFHYDVKSDRGVGNGDQSLDGATYLALRDNAKTIDVAAQGASGWGVGVNMTAQNRAVNVRQARVTAGYFAVLGIPPFMGREFTAGEDREGGPPVAILSYPMWARVFDSRPDIIGTPIALRGEPYTVVGVMPAGFNPGSPADVWTPLRPSERGEGGGTNYGLTARLRPGVGWEQANAEVNVIASPVFVRQMDRNRDGSPPDVTCSLSPLQAVEVADIRQPLLMLWGAVGVVLLIACVNIAGLLIARSGLRTREIATRMALGSGRRAVVRQLLVESGVLALLGGVAGIGVGWLVLEGLKRLGADVFELGYPIALDARVLGASLAIAVATSVVFGLMPALYASRVDVQGTLAESGTRAVAGARSRWPRRILVVAEVALGVVLLVAAGLLMRTFMHLRGLDPGFDPSHVTTAMVSLQDARYQDATKVNQLFERSLARIRQQPGIEAAGVTLGLPYTRLLNMGFSRIEGYTKEDPGGATNISYVTPGYMEAIKLPIRRGRLFTDADTTTSVPVVIVNEEFVRRVFKADFYKGLDPVGLHIRVAGAERQIVGIVGNARGTASGLAGARGPIIEPYVVYVPASQVQSGFFRQVHVWFSPAWVIRASLPTANVVDILRQSIGGVDPLLPVAKLQSMEEVKGKALAQQRFTASLVVGLGAIALLLAAIGIHGLIASSVTERRRELGIRLALGASVGQVMRDVLVPGVTLATIGVALGSAGAFAVSRLLTSFLWGVAPTDPITYVVVIGGLLAVALIASLLPALRVLRLDPALTLRAE